MPDMVDIEETPEEAALSRRGKLLIEVLGLRPVFGKSNHWHTTWGHKTPLGVARVAKRILEEAEEDLPAA